MVMVMDDDLENIKNLIIKIVELNKKIYFITHNNEYKCNHYDTCNDEYDETYSDLIDTRNLFIKKCNEFIDYPTEKFFIFKSKKQIKFKDESFIGLTLNVPFIDKKEYFCLINLFEHMPKHMWNWNGGVWLFK